MFIKKGLHECSIFSKFNNVELLQRNLKVTPVRRRSLNNVGGVEKWIEKRGNALISH